MNIMIFAAGLGTRLKPLTDIIPKALVPVGGKPLLQRVLENVDGRENTVVINIHHHGEQIRNFVTTTRSHWQSEIKLSDETAMLLDTGGGLRKAAPLFRHEGQENGLPVLIHNVDILSDVNLVELYGKSLRNDATLLVSGRKTSRYLLFDTDMRLAGWTNVLTGEIKSPYKELREQQGDPQPLTLGGRPLRMLAFSGIHVFSQSLFPLMDSMPEKFGIIDFYLGICAERNIRGIVKEDLRLLDVGKLDTLETATEFLNQL
ncbi:MAG: sugar phosphate nucleotidyltransferase [Bacteroidales bacterium]|nr:sugar phosphate nucleotidyltransferase [Bacteroidales bacterium]MCM1147514.1 sugar phosphate nucleotidyltransferase [Bacteroidales bacterium]MCM1206183.1 sugar phosphate nucleotidyltransferase [Bacillota bacterium]MCM1509983.1 sugar phosphate nucleotidyltransferase [Clostridium sp.]